METFWQIVLRILLMLPLIATLACMYIDIRMTEKHFKEVQKLNKEIDKVVDEKCKEIEDGIGKELAETKKDNERLKNLCDRTIAAAEKRDEELEQLRKENAELKEKSKAKQTKK